MADTHEEQLLTGLLRDLAREDGRLDAAHLEARVLESASIDARPVSRSRVKWIALPVAAVMVVAIAATVRRGPAIVAPEHRAGDTDRSTEAVRAADDAASRPARNPPARRHQVRPAPAEPSVAEVPAAPEPSPSLPIAPPTAAADRAIEFVPLTPIAEQELTGSFQIVRVQIPGASLGALRPPHEQPGALVEADVLLGEDGRARAIRLNTSGSIYPWRSR
jgi:hypothetical protein